MKKILKKLQSSSGESIIEILCAILIAALSLVALTGMVSTSANMNRWVKKMETEFHAASDAITSAAKSAYTASANGDPNKYTLIVKSGGAQIQTYDNVKTYSDDNDTFTAYILPDGGAT